jgi:hypothetical protein
MGFFGGSPKTSAAPVLQTEEEKRKAKLNRSALLTTEGGLLGQELTTSEVSKRDTLFGN